MASKRNIKCSECEYGEYLSPFNAYTCKNQDCKDVIIFKGKTHPHNCPLIGGKKYLIHGNLNGDLKDRVAARLPYRG